PVKRCNEAKLELVRMNIIKQQGGMFGPNKNISEWCIPQNEGKSPKTRDKTSLKLGDCYPSNWGIAIPQNRGTQKTLLQKKKEKIIRPRILANPLTSQKTIFLWLNRMLQFRAAASG
nr:replication protein [Escherichia coli]